MSIGILHGWILKLRKFYMDNYGDVNSGKRLKAFLKKIYPDLSPCEYVKFPVS